MQDSNLDIMSANTSQIGKNLTSVGNRTGYLLFAKPKKREPHFNSQTWMLDMINGSEYDKYDDLNKVELNVFNAIIELKKVWRTNDIDYLRHQIKMCVIKEVYKVEERKRTRMIDAEEKRKAREK